MNFVYKCFYDQYWVKGWCHEIPYGPEIFVHNLEGVRTWGRRKWCWTKDYNDSYHCLGESGICRDRKNRLGINLHRGDTQFASLGTWTRRIFYTNAISSWGEMLNYRSQIFCRRIFDTDMCWHVSSLVTIFAACFILCSFSFSFFLFCFSPSVVEQWDFFVVWGWFLVCVVLMSFRLRP